MKYKNILHILAISMTTVSCVEDMPEATSSLTEEYYNRHFIYNYGELDNSHTWTYAQRGYINVKLPSALKSESDRTYISVYTDEPTEGNCRLLARYPLSQTSFGFDFVLGCDDVYVEITDNSNYVLYSTKVTLKNNVANIKVPDDLEYGNKSATAVRMKGAPNDINGILWILAAEDIMYYSTFDFNDVVLGLSYASGSEQMTIYPLAAGTPAEVIVYLDNKELGEIHEMFGLADETPVNNMTFDGIGKPFTVKVPANYTLTENMGNFKFIVTGKEDPILPPTTGSIPQVLLLPHTWHWPVEGISIGTAYPDFHWWCSDKRLHEWLQSPEDNIVEHNW